MNTLIVSGRRLCRKETELVFGDEWLDGSFVIIKQNKLKVGLLFVLIYFKNGKSFGKLLVTQS